MTVDSILEGLREGQPLEIEPLKKHMGGYRVRDVDQYKEKLHEKIRSMENVYQERLEEMRTNLLGITRERDMLAARITELEGEQQNVQEMCRNFLRENGLYAVSGEKYKQLESVDLDQFGQLDSFRETIRSLEGENSALLDELEKARNAQKENRDESAELQELTAQLRAQAQALEQHKAQLQIQSGLAQQRQAQMESLESRCAGQSEQLERLKLENREMEIQNRHLQEMNRLLAREKDCLDKEASLWESERKLFVNRFNKILNGQKQYMEHLRQSIDTSIAQMEKISEADFLILQEAANPEE